MLRERVARRGERVVEMGGYFKSRVGIAIKAG
jgi:hypothetical protein